MPTHSSLFRKAAARPSIQDRLLTSEEFLDWLQPGILANLIRGEIYPRSAVNLRHATMVNFVDHLLSSYLEEMDLGGVLHRGAVAVRLNVRDSAGDLLEEFGAGVEKIASTSIPGFWVKRAWLDPEKIPKVGACLKEIVRSARRS